MTTPNPTPAPLSAERLAEYRALERAATPGPWEEYPEYGAHFYAYLRGEHLRGVGSLDFGEGEEADADRAFVVAARTAVPELLAEVERLTAELEGYKDRLAHLEQATLPDLYRQIEWHRDGKVRWRKRSVKAEGERARFKVAWASARQRAQAYGEGRVAELEAALAAEPHATDGAVDVLRKAIEAARGEYLTDNTGDPEDAAYNRGVSDAVAAIGALSEAGGR